MSGARTQCRPTQTRATRPTVAIATDSPRLSFSNLLAPGDRQGDRAECRRIQAGLVDGSVTKHVGSAGWSWEASERSSCGSTVWESACWWPSIGAVAGRFGLGNSVQQFQSGRAVGPRDRLGSMLSELPGVGPPADSACTPPTCRRAGAVRYEQDPLRVVARRRRARAAAGALTLYSEVQQQLCAVRWTQRGSEVDDCDGLIVVPLRPWQPRAVRIGLSFPSSHHVEEIAQLRLRHPREVGPVGVQPGHAV